MALSGSITKKIGATAFELITSWTATQGTSGASMYSDIIAKCKIRHTVGGAIDIGGNISITIDGTEKSIAYTAGFPITSGIEIEITSHSKRVYHNTSGARTFNLKSSVNVGSLGNTSTDNDYQLNNITPPYAKITDFSLSNATLSSVQVSWGVDVACDAIQYSLNGGGWIPSGGNPFTIDGLNPGTQYSVKIRVRRTSNQLWTESGVLYVTTIDKNRVTSTTINVNCDSPLVVTAINPSGNRCDIEVYLVNAERTARIGTSIRHNNTLNTTFTVEEIQSLANYIPNNNSANFRINAITVVGGVDTYADYKDGTYTIVNANPQFDNFTYEDTNPVTLDLTENNQIMVKGYSNLKATIRVANKARPQKGATMVGYRLVVGSKQCPASGTEPYKENDDVVLTLNAIDNNVFTIYAIDSRGNSSFKQLSPFAYQEYTPIGVTSAKAERTGSVGEETTLLLNGTIWNYNFGSVANAIKSCGYDYKKSSTEVYKEPTITTANPCVVTYANHMLSNGSPVVFTTTGTLPTGIVANTIYYTRVIDANTFNLYDTSAHAIAGGTTGRKITTGSQSGTHSLYRGITPILSGNTYSLSSLIAGDKGALGFDMSDYNIRIMVTDKLSTKTYELLLQTGKPPIDICEGYGLAFGGVYDTKLGGPVQVDGLKVLTTNNVSNSLNETSIEKTLSAAQGKILNDNIKSIEGLTPIAIVPLYIGAMNVTRGWQSISKFYAINAPEGIPSVKPGYKRLIRMVGMMTDDGSNGSTAIVVNGFSNTGADRGPYFSFSQTWGAANTNAGYRTPKASVELYDLSTIGTGWIDFRVIIAGSSNATGGAIYALHLYYYDVKI